MTKTCNFIQRGDKVEYLNSGLTDILYGAVVPLTNIVGIAASTILAGETGIIDIAGVYSGPKVAVVIAVGAVVYWDAAASKFTTTATGNTPAGYAIEAAASGDAEVIFKLAPVIKSTVVDNTTLQYTNGNVAAIASGDVVSLTTRICVAKEAIAKLATGSLAVQGTFTLAKKTAEAFTLGQKLYWIVADKALTGTAGSNVPAGWATAAAAEADTTASVKLEV